MVEIKLADRQDIQALTVLRVEQQIEDWENTLPSADFKQFETEFKKVIAQYLETHLNKSIYFEMMYIDGIPVAMCGLEELDELPQITVCLDRHYRHGSIVSVYTRPEYRGKGYQQQLVNVLLNFAADEKFSDITLTTNTADAIHIYEKFGFQYISNKYYLDVRKINGEI